MACLLGAKTLGKKLEWNVNHNTKLFFLWNNIWNSHLQKSGHSVQASTCQSKCYGNSNTMFDVTFVENRWVRSQRCGCLVTWFCYQMIAKPGNKTAAPSWPDPDRRVIHGCMDPILFFITVHVCCYFGDQFCYWCYSVEWGIVLYFSLVPSRLDLKIFFIRSTMYSGESYRKIVKI